VVVQVSHLYVNAGLIIAVYNLVFVFFEKNFDFRNLFSANSALSAFVILIPISLDQSFLTLSMAPKYWNSLTFSKLIALSSSSVFPSFYNNSIIFVFSLLIFNLTLPAACSKTWATILAS